MKTVSIISIVYGALGIIWAAAGTVAIRIQQAVFTNFPFPEEAYEIIDISALLENVWGLVGTLMPFVFLIALIYIISGILQLTGNASFRTLANIAAILNIIWYITYILLIQLEVVPLINDIEYLPNGFMSILVIFGSLINMVFYCGYPVFLLFYMRKGREWDTLDTGYKS